MNDPVVAIAVAGGRLEGWEEVSITLRAEGFPNEFSIGFSAPGAPAATVAKAGDLCRVQIDGDTVVTGYVDRDVSSIAPEAHALTIVGRGKTADLVDCSAEYGASAITNATALDVARELCLVFEDLDAVLAPGTDEGDRVDQLPLDYTDTAASIIQRVAQAAGLLAYENGQGQLVLSRVGTRTAASGAVYGKNVLAATCTNSMDERFSEIVCSSVSQDMLINVAALSDKGAFYYIGRDPNVPRHRRRVIVTELAEDPEQFTITKAKWELARRAGRSTSAQVTLDSWRDVAGRLWEPNTLIPVDLPGLRAPEPNLIISEVTFHRSNERGTVADLVVMPASAFSVEPIVLVPSNTRGIVSPGAGQ